MARCLLTHYCKIPLTTGQSVFQSINVRSLVVTRSVVALVALLGCLTASACTPTADGGPVDRGAKKAFKEANKGKRKKRPARAVAGGVNFRRPSRNLADYVSRGGYIVKGTDFLTFWPCDSEGYYLMLPAPSVAGRLSQQYRLTANRPYVPVYGSLRTRFVADSITVGAHFFNRYAEVIEYTPTARSDAKCAPPSRAILSDELQRLDNFRVVRR